MAEFLLHSAIQHSVLLVIPILCALLLREARCPGWPVVAGVLAGILLGPSIFGRAWPETHEFLFVGGVEERQAYTERQREVQREILANQHISSDPQAIVAVNEGAQSQLDDAWNDWLDAKWRQQRPLRSYTSLMIVLTMLTSGLLMGRRAPANPHHRTASLSIGGWAAVLPGATAFFVLWRTGVYDKHVALFCAAAVSIGPLLLPQVDRDVADQAEHGGAALIRRSSVAASLLALITALVAAWSFRGWEGMLWCLPLLSGLLAHRMPTLTNPAIRRAARRVLEFVLIPNLACCAALRVDLFGDVSIWIGILLLLLSGDGRWAGATIGALLPGGRALLRTMRLTMGASACGVTQLAVIAITTHLHAIPNELMIGLLAGVLYIELSTPLRRSVAQRIIEAEEEWEKLKEEDADPPASND
jgi:hypothetical protein